MLSAQNFWGWYNGGVNWNVYGTGNTNTSLTITGLAPGSSQQWGVRAFDAQGYASAFNYGFTVSNPVPAAPQMASARPTPTGGFQFTLNQTSTLQTVVIQATSNSADPNSWTQIASILPTSNPFTFTDPNAAQYPMRFYRVILP